MEYQRTACMYLVSSDSQVLLIKHPKFGVWLPPGGHVESGESTRNALRREMLEEVGYDIGEGIEYVIDNKATRVVMPFFVQLEDHGDHHVEAQFFNKYISIMPVLHSPEGLEMRWWSQQEVIDSNEFFDNTKEHIEIIMEELR